MTKQEALRYFRKNVLPYIRSKDRTAIREAWNNLMDSMYHDGQISERSYQTWVGPSEGKTRQNPQPKKSSTRRARIDRKGTAKPRSRIVGRFPEGQCIGPFSTPPGGYEYRESKPQRKTGRDAAPNINRPVPPTAGCPVGTQAQTLILSKTFFNQREAESWIIRHDFRISKIDETTNSWRFRQQPPEWFEKRSFRTIRLRPGVQAVIGCPRD